MEEPRSESGAAGAPQQPSQSQPPPAAEAAPVATPPMTALGTPPASASPPTTQSSTSTSTSTSTTTEPGTSASASTIATGALPPRTLKPGGAPRKPGFGPLGPKKLEHQPFFQSREGKRVIFYAVLLICCAGTLFLKSPWRRPEVAANAERVTPIAPVGQVARIRPRFEPPKGEATAGGREVAYHGMLESVVDYQSLESLPPDAADTGYGVLKDHVSRLTDEETASQVVPDLDFEKILADPISARGKFVRLTGLQPEWEAKLFDPAVKPASEAGGDVWRGFVVDPSGTECYIVDVVETPPAATPRRDLIEVEGAFLKVVFYETQDGAKQAALFFRKHDSNQDGVVEKSEWEGDAAEFKTADADGNGRVIPAEIACRRAPVIIARRASVVPEDRIVRPFRVDVLLACVAVGLFILLIIGALWRSRRGDRPYVLKGARARPATGIAPPLAPTPTAAAPPATPASSASASPASPPSSSPSPAQNGGSS